MIHEGSSMDDLVLDQRGRTLTGEGKIIEPRSVRSPRHNEWDLLQYRVFRLYVEKDGEAVGLEMLNEGQDSDYVEIYKAEQPVVEEMCRRIEQFGLKRQPDVVSEDSVPGDSKSSITFMVLFFLGFVVFVAVAAYFLNWLDSLPQ